MKKIFILLVFLFVIFPQKTFALSLFIDNQKIWNNPMPIEKNGRILVPISVVSEKLGAQVDWDNINKTVIITRDTKTIKLQINNKQATVDDKTIILDVAPQIVKDRTMVPLRFIADSLGENVEYISDKKAILINSELSNLNIKNPLQKSDISKSKVASVLNIPENDIIEIGFMDCTNDGKEEIFIKIDSHDEHWSKNIAILSQNYDVLMEPQIYGYNINGYTRFFGINTKNGNFVIFSFIGGRFYYLEKKNILSDEEDSPFLDDIPSVKLLEDFVEVPFEKF